jgi:hypothetical protein
VIYSTASSVGGGNGEFPNALHTVENLQVLHTIPTGERLQIIAFYIPTKFFACDLEVFAVAEYLAGLQEAARLLQPSLLPLLSMLHPGPEHLR